MRSSERERERRRERARERGRERERRYSRSHLDGAVVELRQRLHLHVVSEGAGPLPARYGSNPIPAKIHIVVRLMVKITIVVRLIRSKYRSTSPSIMVKNTMAVRLVYCHNSSQINGQKSNSSPISYPAPHPSLHPRPRLSRSLA